MTGAKKWGIMESNLMGEKTAFHFTFMVGTEYVWHPSPAL